VTMHEAYEQYFGVMHYDERYPAPNKLTLSRVLRHVSPGGILLDIGAGNGRYAIPLASKGYHIVAVEPSDTARDQLKERAAALGLSERISQFKTLADVDDAVIGSADLALFMFGVLGHMCFAEREETLRRLREVMRQPAEAFGSVPNRLRRFRREQVRHRIDDGASLARRFSYSREFGGAEHTFQYTAFAPAELEAELASLGWTCLSLAAESVLGESTVTSKAAIGAGDGLLSRLVPAQFGYDILFHITSAISSDTPVNKVVHEQRESHQRSARLPEFASCSLYAEAASAPGADLRTGR
jgi:SAM-dependent methyltransferase